MILELKPTYILFFNLINIIARAGDDINTIIVFKFIADTVILNLLKNQITKYPEDYLELYSSILGLIISITSITRDIIESMRDIINIRSRKYENEEDIRNFNYIFLETYLEGFKANGQLFFNII